MFYRVLLQHTITVSPKDLGRTLNRRLQHYLRQAVEGKPMPAAQTLAYAVMNSKTTAKSSAIIICVVDIFNSDSVQGRVLDTGNVSFLLTYTALVMKVHRGEVFDTIVQRVGPEGWWGNVYGVGRIFVSQSQMSSDLSDPNWIYESDEADGTWSSKDGTRSIKVNDLVRVRVLAQTPQSQGALAIGTMIGAYLGPV